METIKDIWWAIVDMDHNDMILSVHRFEVDARYEAGQLQKVQTRVERVRITIDRIKT